MNNTSQSRHNRGFTLVETTLANALSGLLVVFIAQAWFGIGRGLADTIAQCRLAQEANMMVTSLSRDTGGSLASMTGQIEEKKKGKATGKFVPDSSQLWICFDGGSNPNGEADWASPDTVIVYRVESDKLIRENRTLGIQQTIAHNVHAIEVKDKGRFTQIEVTLKFRKSERTYELMIQEP